MQMAVEQFTKVEIVLGCMLNTEVAWSKKKFFVEGGVNNQVRRLLTE